MTALLPENPLKNINVCDIMHTQTQTHKHTHTRTDRHRRRHRHRTECFNRRTAVKSGFINQFRNTV